MLKSENARLLGAVYVDIRDRDLQSTIPDLQKVVANPVVTPPRYSIARSGQFEYLARGKTKLVAVVPFTLHIAFVLLYLTFHRFDEAVLIMATLPLALIGGIWLTYLLDHAVSVASVVGFIALAGVAAELGAIIRINFKQALEERLARGEMPSLVLIVESIREGVVLRDLLKTMTASVIIAGLLSIMWSAGTDSEVMRRIAALIVGGLSTAPLLSMRIIPRHTAGCEIGVRRACHKVSLIKVSVGCVPPLAAGRPPRMVGSLEHSRKIERARHTTTWHGTCCTQYHGIEITSDDALDSAHSASDRVDRRPDERKCAGRSGRPTQ